MRDLVEFLRARLDEIEVLARRASTVSPAPWRVDAAAGAIRDAHGAEVAGHWRALPSLAGTVGPDHIVCHDPARVLAEVDAKRRIVEDIIGDRHRVVEDCWYTCPAATEDHDGGVTCLNDADGECDCGRDARVERRLRLLASPYADHPDYNERWRP